MECVGEDMKNKKSEKWSINSKRECLGERVSRLRDSIRVYEGMRGKVCYA